MVMNLLRKILLYALTLFFVVTMNFCIVHLMPGDALVHLLGEEGAFHLKSRDVDALNTIRKEYGLDGSWSEKFSRHVVKTLKGEWGFTFHHGRSVAGIVFERLVWTLYLFLPAVFMSAVLGGWIGALSGWRSRSRKERVLPAVFLILYAFPGYCMGLLLLTAAVRVRFFPMGGMMPEGAGLVAVLQYMVLPLTVLTVHGTAYTFMIMRNAVRQELDRPYVLTAMSKGLTDRRILFSHILKNTLPTYVSVVALHIGFMVGGTLLVEVVFSWQGMGGLIYHAVLSRDFPLLSGCLMVLCLSVLAANLAADLLYGFCDPRIRDGVYGIQ